MKDSTVVLTAMWFSLAVSHVASGYRYKTRLSKENDKKNDNKDKDKSDFLYVHTGIDWVVWNGAIFITCCALNF